MRSTVSNRINMNITILAQRDNPCLSTVNPAVYVGNLAIADPKAKQKQLWVGRF